MKKKNLISPWAKLIFGLLIIFLFTQINWVYFYKTDSIPSNEEIDNTALFYTESEKAMNSAFFQKKNKE